MLAALHGRLNCQKPCKQRDTQRSFICWTFVAIACMQTLLPATGIQCTVVTNMEASCQNLKMGENAKQQEGHATH